ncbi:MAG TPA: hypothetical protein VGO56_00190 [Pyrinomonadaceae bacterium]|jgi:hypothetical protein|nr:hypothetical protein [Pyrinomonadaceae bacterium]
MRPTIPIFLFILLVAAIGLVLGCALALHYACNIPLNDMSHLSGVIDPVLIIVIVLETVALIVHSFKTDAAVRTTNKSVTATTAAVQTIQGSVDTTKAAVDMIGKSVKLLERDKVYLRLIGSAQSAEIYIHHLSFAQSTSTGGEEEEQRRVVDFLASLKSACSKLSGPDREPDVKILGPNLREKIGGLWERKLQGCEVRVSGDVQNYDIRIQVVDDKTAVIGVGPLANESERGFLIESYMLADTLNDRFMKLWNNPLTTPLNKFTIERAMENLEMTGPLDRLREIIRDSFHVPVDEITHQIIKLLVDEDRLMLEDNYFYRSDTIHELQQKRHLTDAELKQCLIDKGTGLSDQAVAKFVNLVRKVDGNQAVGYTTSQPPNRAERPIDSEPGNASPPNKSYV